MQDVRYLTVTALTKYLKNILEQNEHLRQIYIKGEISNLTKHSRGHYYFTLKDDGAQIRVTMFANYVSKLNYQPKDGDKVRILGTISLYEAGGSYNINAFQMEPDGIGSLYLAYEKLKKELQSLGYFDPKHKKPIPKYPKAIGVITSPTGAAIRDIIHTTERRYPLATLYLYPALVQGEGAKKSVSDQIKKANQDGLVDVLIVGRGGGSIEDLWGFNEIEVVMAIFESKIPVISAVGHETDFTLSDFVSDLIAPTPTAGAELATPQKADLMDLVDGFTQTMTKSFDYKLNQIKQSLLHLDERLLQASPKEKIKNYQSSYQKLRHDLNKHFNWVIQSKNQRLDNIYTKISTFDFDYLVKMKKKKLSLQTDKLNQLNIYIFKQKRKTFESHMQSLKLLNPLTLMEKGYTYTTKDNKRIDSIDQVQVDDIIQTRIKDGHITSVVKNKEALPWKK